MNGFNQVNKPARSTIGAVVAGGPMIGCCIVGSLPIGAACVLALSAVSEVAAALVVATIWGLALWRRKASRMDAERPCIPHLQLHQLAKQKMAALTVSTLTSVVRPT
jgi:hypothetical protein